LELEIEEEINTGMVEPISERTRLALLLVRNNSDKNIENRVIQLLAGSIGDLATKAEVDKLQIIFHEGQKGLSVRVENAEEVMTRLEKIWARVRLAVVGGSIAITTAIGSGQVLEFVVDTLFGV
jgi:hypothetical protein